MDIAKCIVEFGLTGLIWMDMMLGSEETGTKSAFLDLLSLQCLQVAISSRRLDV